MLRPLWVLQPIPQESYLYYPHSELIERYITNLVSIGKLPLGKPFITTKNFTRYQISIFDGFYSVSKIKHKNNIGYGACFSYNKNTSAKNSLLEAVVLADGITSYGMRAVGCKYSDIHKTYEITGDIREFIYIVERNGLHINDQFRFVHQAIFY